MSAAAASASAAYHEYRGSVMAVISKMASCGRWRPSMAAKNQQWRRAQNAAWHRSAAGGGRRRIFINSVKSAHQATVASAAWKRGAGA